MRLSSLQKFILKKCYNQKDYNLNRELLLDFYVKKGAARRDLQTKIITQSIESLIDKELMVGFGLRTSHKWFIRDIKLTDKGVKVTKKLFGEQLKLPIKKNDLQNKNRKI